MTILKHIGLEETINNEMSNNINEARLLTWISDTTLRLTYRH